ncbi:21978_t:CDS:2, partial [Gigaspora margarita]
FSETEDALHHAATFWKELDLCLLLLFYDKIFPFFDEENHGVDALTSHLSLDVTYFNNLADFKLGKYIT